MNVSFVCMFLMHVAQIILKQKYINNWDHYKKNGPLQLVLCDLNGPLWLNSLGNKLF